MVRAGAVRIGISGWSYVPWCGVCYPKGVLRKRVLEYAASQFDTQGAQEQANGLKERTDRLRTH
jgi:hypothetical protein